MLAQEAREAENQALARQRAHYETTNLPPPPDRDYPYLRSDMTETFIQPEVTTNRDDIRAWTEKAGIEYNVNLRSQPPSSSSGPSGIPEEPTNIEAAEKAQTVQQDEYSRRRKRSVDWVEQVTDRKGDDFEDPHTNPQGLSYPTASSGYVTQGELSSPFENARFPVRTPVYANYVEPEGDDSEAESEDMYGASPEPTHQGPSMSPGAYLEEVTEEVAEYEPETEHDPEPEAPQYVAGQHLDEADPEAESDEGSEEESDEESEEEPDEGSEGESDEGV